MKRVLYLMKIPNGNEDYCYGIFAPYEDTDIRKYFDEGITNITRLNLDEVECEIGYYFSVIYDYDDSPKYHQFNIVGYLHRKNILEASITEVYVSPLAYHYIISNYIKDYCGE